MKSKRAAAPKTKHESKATDLKRPLDQQDADAQKGSRRALTRRLTDEQTDRFIERKLSHISISIIETVENREGVEAQ